MSLQCYAMDCLVKTGGVNLPSTASILKKIVNDDKTNNNQCAELVKLLSFCVCFPVSEAIVENWGSTIRHLYAIKHNPLEPSDDLTDAGTIDKFTFVRLCGPPPGMRQNRKLFEFAQNYHLKSKFSRHFVNTSRIEQVTSKVVDKIINPKVNNVLPCFIQLLMYG